MTEYENDQIARQHFEIRDHVVGNDPMVDVLTWFGTGNKAGISVYTENLVKLRDTLNEYLEDTCYDNHCECDFDD